MRSVTWALKHPDKLGAGAAKRKYLKPEDRIKAVMLEYKRGTLRSGSGEKVKNRKQALAIALSESRKVKIRRRDGVVQYYHVANKVVKKLKPHSRKIIVAGSIRRGKQPNDVDLVVVPKHTDMIRSELKKLGRIKTSGEQQITTKIDGVDVDVFFSKPEELGAQLLTRTGPAGANIQNRELARDKGMLLNQHGLFKGSRRIAGRTEEEIYKALGKPYRPPKMRGTPR